VEEKGKTSRRKKKRARARSNFETPCRRSPLKKKSSSHEGEREGNTAPPVLEDEKGSIVQDLLQATVAQVRSASRGKARTYWGERGGRDSLASKRMARSRPGPIEVELTFLTRLEGSRTARRREEKAREKEPVDVSVESF